ncbi:hypothetical protein AJ79_05083 [Helicocarpus griseus UAMH5409]|uniref:Uncharacterized protein n=1 Tax=Helicocarpus griseus UAMH5409 TaxID=1447875 RepID=A0A2B7XQJ7_9EURO|nr:hypothetical protein AJ79_05083 [Helicocarpus griseus UAMH5409]
MYPPPLLDVRRFPMPYIKGWEFTVQSHTPPPPTPVTYNCCLADETARNESEQIPPVERCLRHPPLPGSIGSGAVDLKVIDPVVVEDGRNAQVVAVQVVKATPENAQLLQLDKKLVAKIYEPSLP